MIHSESPSVGIRLFMVVHAIVNLFNVGVAESGNELHMYKLLHVCCNYFVVYTVVMKARMKNWRMISLLFKSLKLFILYFNVGLFSTKDNHDIVPLNFYHTTVIYYYYGTPFVIFLLMYAHIRICL